MSSVAAVARTLHRRANNNDHRYPPRSFRAVTVTARGRRNQQWQLRPTRTSAALRTRWWLLSSSPLPLPLSHGGGGGGGGGDGGHRQFGPGGFTAPPLLRPHPCRSVSVSGGLGWEFSGVSSLSRMKQYSCCCRWGSVTAVRTLSTTWDADNNNNDAPHHHRHHPTEPTPSNHNKNNKTNNHHNHHSTEYSQTTTEEEQRYWKRVTLELLERRMEAKHDGAQSLDHYIDWDMAVQVTRYWLKLRTADSVSRAWTLWDALFAPIWDFENPGEHLPDYLLSGNYPLAVHTLNGILDAWRIVWEEEQKGPEQQTDQERGNKKKKTSSLNKRKRSQPLLGEYESKNVDDPSKVWNRLIQLNPHRFDARSITCLLTVLSKYPEHRSDERYSAPLMATEAWDHLKHATEFLDRAAKTNNDETDDDVDNDDDSPFGRGNHRPSPPILDRSPDVVAFTALLLVWANSHRHDAPWRARELWIDWIDWNDRRDHRLPGHNPDDETAALEETRTRRLPNTYTYGTMLQLLCAAQPSSLWLPAAEQFLEHMLDPVSNPDPFAGYPSDGSSNRHPLTVHDNDKDPDQDDDDDAIDRPLHGHPHPPPVNEVSIDAVVGAHATAGNIEQAVAWLRRLLDGGHFVRHDTFSQTLSRTVPVYRQLLWTVGNDDSETAAKTLYDEAIAMAAAGDEIIRLYDQYLGDNGPPTPYWTRALVKWHSAVGRPLEAERELDRLEAVDIAAAGAGSLQERCAKYGHYQDVLRAWEKLSQSGSSQLEAARGGEAVLFRLIAAELRGGESSLHLDAQTVNRALGLWSAAAVSARGKPVESEIKDPPEATNDDDDGPEERAERLMRLLQRIPGVKFDEHSYHLLIQVWVASRHPDSGFRVEALIRELEEHPKLQPSRFNYTSAMVAWRQIADTVPDRHAVALRLERLLEAAKSQAYQGNRMARPDDQMYGTLLHAHATLGDGPLAERTFDRLWEYLRQKGVRNPTPPISKVNQVLLAWQRSDCDPAEALSRANQFIEKRKLWERDLKPDARTETLLSWLRTK